MLGGVTAQDKALFFRSLSAMFRVGVGIVDALDMAAQQTEKPAMLDACQGVARFVQEGRQLSEGMQRFPDLFDPVSITMTRLGERSGALAIILEQLAEHQERLYHLRRQMASSLTTPLIVVLGALAMAFFVPPLLFGSLFELVRDLGVEVPAITRLLMGLSFWMRQPAFYAVLLLVCILGSMLVRRLLKNADNRRRADAALLQLPAFGKLWRLSATTRFTRGLTTMVRVGAPILEALPLAAGVSGSHLLQHYMQRAVQALKDGEDLARALENTEFFTPTYLATVEVGLDSGKLSELLESVSSLYETELEHGYEVLAATLEPAALLLVAALVGFMGIGALMPMVRVLQAL